jgi:hypothetical protein
MLYPVSYQGPNQAGLFHILPDPDPKRKYLAALRILLHLHDARVHIRYMKEKKHEFIMRRGSLSFMINLYKAADIMGSTVDNKRLKAREMYEKFNLQFVKTKMILSNLSLEYLIKNFYSSLKI